MYSVILSVIALSMQPASLGSGQQLPPQTPAGKPFGKPVNQVNETIYVADRGAQRIVKIDNLTGAGWATLTATTIGLSTLPISSVATDKQGRLYFCASGVLHRVDAISGAGHVSMTLPSGAGQDSRVAVRSNGWVYVTIGNGQVNAYDKVGTGAVLKWQGTWGGSPTPPNGLFVSPTGDVTVASETVIPSTNPSQYAGMIVELKASGGSPVAFLPVTTLRGVTRDVSGKIYYSYASGIGRIDSIAAANSTLWGTSNQAVGCALGSGRIFTTMPSAGKIGAISLTPSGGQVWYGSTGTGVGQFSNPVDIALFARDPKAL